MEELKIEELNKVWRTHTGTDLTEKEAWGMVDFVKMILENADRKLDEELKKNNN